MTKNIRYAMIIALISISCTSTHEHSNCSDDHNKSNGKSLTTCTDSHDEEDKTISDDHTGVDEHTSIISFSKEQAKAVGLETMKIDLTNFVEVIKTSGQIQVSQGQELTIVATSNGIISFSNNSIIEGSSIKKGELFASISAKELLDGDPIKKINSAYEVALKEYERAKELVKDQIISIKEFEQTKLTYEKALTAYQAQSSNSTEKGMKVSFPINGYLKNRLVNQGDFVSIGQPIAMVSQNKHLQLRAEVSENYYNKLATIAGANFVLPYDGKLYKLVDLNGKLLSYGKNTTMNSFYIPITFEFDNIGDLVPGSFVEVFLHSSPIRDVICVPNSALSEEQGLYFVYVKICESEYKKQEVTKGASDGERVLITSGLNVGDNVVIKGVYQVKLAATSTAIPDGHNH